jgi:hypothetical protein
MKSLVVGILICMAAIVAACAWDRDTLGMELKRFPGLTEVMTGRFERNPPLFYQMRLDRVTKEIAETPKRLDLYDDAGVACDRLGKSDEAIEWMAKKKAILDRSPDKEHLYRYHANLGTFLAHKWLRGKDNRDMTLLREGRDHIAKAIEINPDAHFGREKVQLAVMDWAIHIREWKRPANDWDSPRTLQDFLRDANLTMDDNIKGLSGLVVLGNAWESVDVYNALSETLAWQDASLATLAALRAEELLKAGRKSVDPKFKFSEYRVGAQLEDDGAEVKEYYPVLREEADEWAAERESYMMERLKQGRHPDTDPSFWKEWEDDGPPEIAVPLMNWARMPWYQTLFFGGLGLLVAVGLFVSLRLRLAKKRAAAGTR